MHSASSAPPKAAKAPSSRSDEAPASSEPDRERRRLILFLRQTQEFRLALVLYNDLLTRDALIRALTVELAGAGVRVLTLDLREVTADRSLYARVESLVKTAPPGERVVVMVVNLESQVHYTPELSDLGSSGTAFLETANFHRELFPHACPGPLVIWTTELLERAFVHHAPDLWHWRSHTFDLRTQIETRAAGIIPATPESHAAVSSGDYRLHPAERLHRLEEELAAYRKAGDRQDEMRVLNEIGKARLDAGDARLALKGFEAVLKIARELEHRVWEGKALGNLGSTYSHLGESRRAVEFHEQSLAIARETGDRRGEGNALNNLGAAYADLGEFQRAKDFYEQDLVITRAAGNRRDEGTTLGNLGNVYAALGEPRQAIEFHKQHQTIAHETGDRLGECRALTSLGIDYDSLGETHRAKGYHERALAVAHESGDRRGEGVSLWNAALNLDALGDREEALAYAEKALRLLEAVEHPMTDTIRAQLAEWCGQ